MWYYELIIICMWNGTKQVEERFKIRMDQGEIYLSTIHVSRWPVVTGNILLNVFKVHVTRNTS